MKRIFGLFCVHQWNLDVYQFVAFSSVENYNKRFRDGNHIGYLSFHLAYYDADLNEISDIKDIEWIMHLDKDVIRLVCTECPTFKRKITGVPISATTQATTSSTGGYPTADDLQVVLDMD